jgi:hypothetical protein
MSLTPHNLTYHDQFYKDIILNSVASYVEHIVSMALLKMNMHDASIVCKHELRVVYMLLLLE